jgi:hypothetical protein
MFFSFSPLQIVPMSKSYTQFRDFFGISTLAAFPAATFRAHLTLIAIQTFLSYPKRHHSILSKSTDILTAQRIGVFWQQPHVDI